MTGPPVVLKTVLLILLGLEALRIATIHVYLNREWRWALAVFLIMAFGIRFLFTSGGPVWISLTLLLLWAAGNAALLFERRSIPPLWNAGSAAVILAWIVSLVLVYPRYPGSFLLSIGPLAAASVFPIASLAGWAGRTGAPGPRLALIGLCGWLAAAVSAVLLSGRDHTMGDPELWYALVLAGGLVVYRMREEILRRELGRIGGSTEQREGTEVWTSLLELERLETVFFQQERLVSIGYLAAGMVHDVKNLLAYTATCAELGLKRADLETKHKALQAIADNVQAAESSMASMLTALSVSKREEPTDLEPVRFLQGFVTKVRKNFRLENIIFRLETAAPVRAVHIRAGELEQVLLNLVRNAVQAFRSRPEERERAVVLRCASMGGSVMIEVCDNAGGMGQDEGATVFEPGPSAGSAGMGLVLAKKIVSLNGGRIEFIPTRGGVCFRIVFPLPPG